MAALCGGRQTVWRLLAAARPGALALPPAQAHKRAMTAAAGAVQASGSQPAAGRRGGVRPSKTAAKQEAKHFQDMARQLSCLTEKQLVRLEPIVGEEVVAAVGVAMRISHRNQGRQRQESLVARLLRESVVEEAEVAQLKAAIESVKTGQGVIANPAVDRQLDAWVSGLLAGQQEAATEVFGLAQQQGADLQEIRQLVRQAQQVEPVPVAAAASDDEESSSSSSSEAAPEQAPSSSAATRSTAKAKSARKQLRKLLQPLAEAHLADDDDEEEER